MRVGTHSHGGLLAQLLQISCKTTLLEFHSTQHVLMLSLSGTLGCQFLLGCPAQLGTRAGRRAMRCELAECRSNMGINLLFNPQAQSDKSRSFAIYNLIEVTWCRCLQTSGASMVTEWWRLWPDW
jgi:hypothetical protein